MMFTGLVGFALVVGALSFLYTQPSGSGNRVSVLTDEVGRLVGQTLDGQLLYIATSKNSEDRGGGGGMMEGSDLIVLNPRTGESRVIAQNVWTAQASPNGKEIVVADSNNKVQLYSIDGTKKAQIGNNGSDPIFTHDGRYIAYQKLADVGRDYLELSTNAQGLALYDITTGKERMLTRHSGDYRPIGFSADMKYFYFNAGRPYEPSVLGENFINITSGLYSLDVGTGRVTRLTNTDERVVQENGQTMSFITHDALWTSDRLTAISGVGQHGTYKFVFDGTGGLTSIDRISDGDSPRWVVQDKRFEVRTIVDNKESWKLISVK